jgi:hypothetical protein
VNPDQHGFLALDIAHHQRQVILVVEVIGVQAQRKLAVGGGDTGSRQPFDPQGRPVCAIEGVLVTCVLAWDEWWHWGTHRPSLYLRGWANERICGRTQDYEQSGSRGLPD